MNTDERDPNFRKNLLEFLENHFRSRLERKRNERVDLEEKYGINIKDRYDAEIKLVELEEELENLKRSLAMADQFGEEFERIMRMDGVNKITASDTNFCVETKRIYQMVGSQISPGPRHPYDIGQYKIMISFNKETASAVEDISYIQGEYQGSFTHPHLTNAQGMPCFGSPLREDIKKHISDLHVATLVHLLLAFLRLDNTLPQENRLDETYDPKFEKGYESHDERAKEKEKFVTLMREVMVRNYTRTNTAKFIGAAQSLKTLEERYMGMRNELEEKRKLIKWCEEQLLHVDTLSREVAARLAEKKEVRNVHFERADKTLHIAFEFRNFVFSMVVPSAKPPRIIGCPPEQRSLGFAFDKDGVLKVTEQPNHKELIVLQFKGEIADYFERVYSIFTKSYTEEISRQGGHHGAF